MGWHFPPHAPLPLPATGKGQKVICTSPQLEELSSFNLALTSVGFVYHCCTDGKDASPTQLCAAATGCKRLKLFRGSLLQQSGLPSYMTAAEDGINKDIQIVELCVVCFSPP